MGAAMDVTLAYGVLGLEPDATLEQAKKVYRARALLLHPDRVEHDLRPDAERAMAQLNAAWETVREALQNGVQPGIRDSAPTQASSAPSAPSRRPPAWGECDMCGCSPAKPLSQRRISGALLFWRTGSAPMDLCRTCGRAYFVESQAHCLTKGWWGVFAFWANLFTLVTNWLAARNHSKSLPEPRYRDPAVVTPFGAPVSARPLRQRRLPWVATVVAVAVFAWFAAISGGDSGSGTSPASPAVAGVGTCLTSTGLTTSCSTSDAVYRLTMETSSPDDCSGDAFQDRHSNQWYCSTRLK